MSIPTNLAKQYPTAFAELKKKFSGEIDLREETKILYATDASIYKEKPHAVTFPRHEQDIAMLIRFARQTQTPIIARGGGTSLAGQVVGQGIIADVSLYMNQILEINPKQQWVRVQPGLIRDDLNTHLKPYKLFFAPETASASRATIGGMIGNNSTGSQSIVYGNTREHILRLKGYLADGSPIELTAQTFAQTKLNDPEPSERVQAIGYKLYQLLADPKLREDIKTHFPHPDIKRRNNGYALDALLETDPLNLIPLIAGSEGTLMFITEATLRLTPLPPPACGVIAAHFTSIEAALRANLTILTYTPHACELIDHYILECTEKSIEHRQYRDFIKGRPKAILIIEIRRETNTELLTALTSLQNVLLKAGLSIHAPILTGADIEKPWKIRRAGLGLLSNITGDAKPIALVEDAAVRVEDLPEFVKRFNVILTRYQLSCVHYAHAGAGELHLRPIINIKTPSGQTTIRALATDIATLVKTYRGALSGEHGDGRLRGEFIHFMFGAKLYQLFETVKTLFDPENLFNPHKIVAAPKMNENLRYTPDDYTPNYKTYLDFSPYQGMVQLTEMCNGSGECRRSHLSAGLMCPSYMATRRERDTTRARANILREILKNPHLTQPFAQREVISVLDLCLSCKGCKAQCPSSVDMAALKAEYLSHYYTYHRPSLRTRFFKTLPMLTSYTAFIPSGIKNILLKLFTPVLRILLHLDLKRPLPTFSQHSGTKLIHQYLASEAVAYPKHSKPVVLMDTPQPLKVVTPQTQSNKNTEKIFLFIDEFTNVFDSQAGEKTFLLLKHLGYDITLLPIRNSGRSLISAGFLKAAQTLAYENIKTLQTVLKTHKNSSRPPSKPYIIIGIEPSALLTFRDEQISLLRGEEQVLAKEIASHTLLLEEFLVRELKAKRLLAESFPNKYPSLAYFPHCHQQVLSNTQTLAQLFNLISETPARSLGEGCCGMAGTFGYEREHSHISTDIAKLRLLPNLEKQTSNTLIIATGFSCREQIKFLSQHRAYYTGLAFYQALGLAT